MIEINTFFKIDDRFIPIHEFNGPFPDTFYIDGAIYATINGNEVFTKEMWDLVDQLWAYICKGICKICKGEAHSGHFPDQPLPYSFKVMSNALIQITIGENSFVVNKKEFVSSFADAATDFFSVMVKLLPENREMYQQLIDKVSLCKQQALTEASASE